MSNQKREFVKSKRFLLNRAEAADERAERHDNVIEDYYVLSKIQEEEYEF